MNKAIDWYYGPVGHVEKVKETGLIDWTTCLPQSQKDLPEWAQKIPEFNIVRLRPEHGFMFIDRDGVSGMVNGLYLHRPNSMHNEGKDVFKAMGVAPMTFPGITPIYFKFKQAYLMDYIGRDIPAWWLFPDGHVERVLMWERTKVNFRISKYATASRLIPTKSLSPISGVNTFLIGPLTREGLYSFADSKKPKKLVKGRIGDEIDVSPNGCQVAFMNDDRQYINPHQPMYHYQLEVINLCKENRS